MTNTSQKPYQCNFCQRRFTQPGHVRVHKCVVDQGFKRHICDVCGKQFTQLGSLKKHIAGVHEKLRPHRCESCPSAFCTPSELRRHKENVHNNANARRCRYCNELFNTANDLRQHMTEKHSEKKEFICDLCGECFSRQVAMTRHMNTSHNDDKSRECSACGVSFSSLAEWKSHSNFCSSDPSRNVCQLCGDHFTTVTHLRCHKRTVHQKTKTYDCNQCGQSYVRLNSFKYHCCLQNRSASVKTDENCISSTSLASNQLSPPHSSISTSVTQSISSLSTNFPTPLLGVVPPNNPNLTAIAVLSAVVSSFSLPGTSEFIPNLLKSTENVNSESNVSHEQSSNSPTPLLGFPQSTNPTSISSSNLSAPDVFNNASITSTTTSNASPTLNVTTADQTSFMHHARLTNALAVLNTFASSFCSNGIHLPNNMHSSSNSTNSDTIKVEPISNGTIPEIDPSILS